MKTVFMAVSALLLVTAVPSGFAAMEKTSFDRYQVIIDRAPFGRSNGGGVVSAVASNFMARYAFVGFVGSPENGMLAALVDKQTNQSYFKAPGETMDDVTIVCIENTQPKRRLVLRRGLEVGTLTFGEGAPSAEGMVSPQIAPLALMPSALMSPPDPSHRPVPTSRRRTPFIR